MSGVDDGALTWDIRLSEHAPWKRTVVWIVSVLAATAGWALMGSPLFALIGGGAVLASTAEYWMPIRNRLDARGAHVRVGFSMTSMDWPSVKRVVLADDGVKLSPLEKSGGMSAFRGVYLRFGGHREEILDRLSAYLEKDVRSVAERLDGAGIRGADPESSAGDSEAKA